MLSFCSWMSQQTFVCVCVFFPIFYLFRSSGFHDHDFLDLLPASNKNRENNLTFLYIRKYVCHSRRCHCFGWYISILQFMLHFTMNLFGKRIWSNLNRHFSEHFTSSYFFLYLNSPLLGSSSYLILMFYFLIIHGNDIMFWWRKSASYIYLMSFESERGAGGRRHTHTLYASCSRLGNMDTWKNA